MIRKNTLFREFKSGMEEFGKTLNAVVNSVLLTIVYFVGVGLSTLIALVTKKRLLDLPVSSEKKSYYESLDSHSTKEGSEFRQF